METVINVEGLTKSYGATRAVSDVSFEVGRGEIFGLLGPNGAGKTTTVEILQGLRSRDGGAVSVLGLDPAVDGGELRRQIGSQLQSAALPARLRVGEAIRLFAPKGTDVDEVMEDWGLASLHRRPFAALSGGQRQRLFLALALLGEPEVVFLDELTTGLDPHARRATWELVERVRDRGSTVVLVTHFMEEAERLCDRVAIIDRGGVAALDTPGALASRRGGAVTSTFTTAALDLSYLHEVSGVETVTREGEQVSVRSDSAAIVTLAAALARSGAVVNGFRTHYPNLEDVFLSVTGRSLSD